MLKYVICLALLLLASPASAQQCMPINLDDVAQGVAAVRNGEMKGNVLVNANAVAFVKSLQLPPGVVGLAVFLVEPQPGQVLLAVVFKFQGQEVVCVSNATEEEIKKFISYLPRA